MNDGLFIEAGGANICKYGETLCGDSLSWPVWAAVS